LTAGWLERPAAAIAPCPEVIGACLACGLIIALFVVGIRCEARMAPWPDVIGAATWVGGAT
jgi:hypothetical protein